ncbi:MAG TPA: SDR family oxidoreductase [Acidimicrobiales bacterium]|nr:SDR family oxidoreductase [Acidimicrobiales bacterium]
MELRGKCVVVTGGAHGIGRALAERFAAEGARVVVADVNARRTDKIAARIDGLPVVCDVGDPDAVTGLVEQAVTAYGPVDVFCSNAGIGDRGPGLASTRDQIDEITRVNLLSHVWAAQEVVPSMVERGGGYLVQTISSASLITGPSGMGYTVTKHGALGFAEWMALNYAHLGITVTCLCPNAVNTGMMGRNEDEESEAEAGTDPVRANIGDIVEPELCAEMTLDAMREGRFLVLPHPRVGESFLRKAGDYDRWLEGTNRRLRRMRNEEI